MPTYTFAANTVEDFVSWNSPSVWSGGIVPNSANADVTDSDNNRFVVGRSIHLLHYD